jgi:hypothetical protein
MELTVESAASTVLAADYRLELRSDPPRAILADHDGRIWTALCLLSGIDRVSCVDECYAPPRIDVAWNDSEDAVRVAIETDSTAWNRKITELRCCEDRLELTVTVTGRGLLSAVTLLGGGTVLPGGAAGVFRSSIDFASVFVPSPTEPVQVVRPAHSAAALGLIGDARPGRLHAVFSPPPLCLVLGRATASDPTGVPQGSWLSLSLQAPVAALGFTEMGYTPCDGGFALSLDYDGHTLVDGSFTTPLLVLRPAGDPYAALARYRADLVECGWASPLPDGPPPTWWRQPIFCGWGAQSARAPLPGRPPAHARFLSELPPAALPAGRPVASDLARVDVYDELLDLLARHGIVPGTVVIDDRWQRAYGGAEPDPGHWPDLRAWIADRHAAGVRVLLWWKAWDPTGVPAGECIRDPVGRPVAVDPGHPGYRERLRRIASQLVGPDSLDADGIKIDFTQRAPAGHALRGANGPGALWGIAALHELLRTMYDAVKATKPDALVVTHAPHPSFGDVCDMVRLNDVLERDLDGRRVPVVDQLRFRAAVVAACLPGHLIDTDQWPMPDRVQWQSYVAAQPGFGVPALYYAEEIDSTGEALTDSDLAAVARSWADYRARLADQDP